MPLYSIHIHYFAEVLPRLFCRGIFKVAVALVFTAVLQIFTRGGREVGARGKDEVLPQPDGSILSGGTVSKLVCSFHNNREIKNIRCLPCISRLVPGKMSFVILEGSN